MAKTAEMAEVSLSTLRPYERNAKTHSAEQIEMLKNSIQEFGFLTPCLIDRDGNIIAGHGRVKAAQELGMETVPCVYVEGLTDAQRRAYILADKRLTELGGWDMNLVGEELFSLADEEFDVDLTGFELPEDWFETRERFDRTRAEGNEEYNAFLDKFEQPKTTDDCYTPDNIYDIIADYVAEEYGKDRAKFVRPFYPGGDYQAYKYKSGSVVVDNPPFSILAQIVDYYIENNQPFFLFAPGLAAMGYTSRSTVTAICTYESITYENGANVTTSFVTNLEDGATMAKSAPELSKAIAEANKENEEKLHKHLPKYEYPYEVLTSAKLGYLSTYGQDFRVNRKNAVFIRGMDAQKEQGSGGIYGGALLLSERAAAERAAAERAAAERAAATKWELSEREREIIKNLGGEE